ncbi:hypothetical protein [Viridibacillus sp. FSL H8-0123]|uniref:hypothetical protein n=1 Tax=Viridibacillus sp. FSL H8-0123 TaxID=1928922 RepID=UPI00096D987D|nr:hypothetical protein [Viridibacillus sp. FSL H8-0123]OMC84143.1 hypothetical protein BK130_06515 [Viridibacillus sp. FSL H8-0123]
MKFNKLITSLLLTSSLIFSGSLITSAQELNHNAETVQNNENTIGSYSQNSNKASDTMFYEEAQLTLISGMSYSKTLKYNGSTYSGVLTYKYETRYILGLKYYIYSGNLKKIM